MFRVVLVLLLAFCQAALADEETNRVRIVDPYLELRTGPGRGYPIFHVVDRGEWVDLVLRKTDWYKVVTPQGKQGWAHRDQLERTLTEAGSTKTFRDVLVEDYLQRRIEFGFSYGLFESDSILTAFGGYKFHDNLSLELAVAESTGSFSSTQLIYGALISHPAPEWVVSPYFGVGYGQFRNRPDATLVGGTETKADMAMAELGARYYLTRRFMVRADWRTYVALINTNRTESYTELSAGLGFFF